MKYRPLQDYLRALPASKDTVSLRFDELEKIIGAKLPKSAFTYPAWWGNQEGGSRAPHWHAAGFKVDSTDLTRRIVRFARDSAAKQRSRPGARKVAPKQEGKKLIVKKEPIPKDKLLDAGFDVYDYWQLTDAGIHLAGGLPRKPCVYAHVVGGEVYYIGRSLKGFKHRMSHYKKPGPTQSTSIRVNGLIKAALKAGRIVEVIAAFPEASSWNGLPVDLVSGLETGLVKKYSPPWNKQGIAG